VPPASRHKTPETFNAMRIMRFPSTYGEIIPIVLSHVSTMRESKNAVRTNTGRSRG